LCSINIREREHIRLHGNQPITQTSQTRLASLPVRPTVVPKRANKCSNSAERTDRVGDQHQPTRALQQYLLSGPSIAERVQSTNQEYPAGKISAGTLFRLGHTMFRCRWVECSYPGPKLTILVRTRYIATTDGSATRCLLEDFLRYC
jgi:hypothetical protein